MNGAWFFIVYSGEQVGLADQVFSTADKKEEGDVNGRDKLSQKWSFKSEPLSRMRKKVL